MMQHAHESGQVIDDALVAKADAFADAWARGSHRFKTTLLAAMGEASTALADFIDQANRLVPALGIIDQAVFGRDPNAPDPARVRAGQAQRFRPMPSTGSTVIPDLSSGGGKDPAESIDKVTEALSFQIEQLARSSREQAVYNALRSAGIGLDDEGSDSIATLAGRLHDLTEAQQEAAKAEQERMRAAEQAARQAERQMERQQALVDDVLFQREQIFRSDVDQQIASSLRSAGIEAESALGKWYASQVRLNDALAETKDLLSESITSLVRDLRSGVGLKEAVSNVVDRIADRALTHTVEQVTNSLFGALGTSLGIGAVGGGLYVMRFEKEDSQ
jgi:hypothetical protein